MAQHTMDTISQLSANNFNKVNVQVNPSAFSANSEIKSNSSNKVPSKIVFDDNCINKESNQESTDVIIGSSNEDDVAKLSDNRNSDSKFSNSKLDFINNSNILSDRDDLDDNFVISQLPCYQNGNLKTNNEKFKNDRCEDPKEDELELSPLLTATATCNSNLKISPKNDRSSLQLKLDKKNVSSKPKLIVNTLQQNPLYDDEDVLKLNGGKSNSRNLGNKRDYEEEDRHVQFDSDHNNSSTTIPLNEACSTPSSISSSSSSSSSSSTESIDISEARPPDGGWGWVIVAVSFIVNLIADGITFSFGVIYHEFLNYFGEDKSTTAWIGSLFMAMPLLSGPIASFLTDRYGCRKVTIVGSILASTGFIASSFANSTLVLYATFGVLSGFGLSLCYVASVVIVAYYFDKRRSFATGLAVCGSGIGTFIFAPLIQVLLDEYGWRGTTLILAGLFLNLAVCGCLMRDLPWTSYKNKSAAKERKRMRALKRNKNKNSSSADTFSVSNSTNTASALQPITECPEAEEKAGNGDDDDEENLNEIDRFSSLVNLPTYVRNGEKVPIEVLELLSSTHKNVYNVLLQNYPSLLTPSRSFSDSGRLHKAHMATKPLLRSPLATTANPVPSPPKPADAAYLNWIKKDEILSPRSNTAQKKNPTAYLKDLRVHRLSLTYRGAMLNINRYRLRASSCPDIYRNSMTTIAKEKMQWYSGLLDFWDLLIDIIDVSHFSNSKFLLFAISNFFLYTWYDVEYMYLTDHASEIGFSTKDSSMLISVIGIVNMFGEIILGWAGDRSWINPGLVYAVCMIFCGLVTGLVPLLKSYTGLCVLAGGFGFFIAANYSLTCIILVELITLERFTNAYGLLLLVQGVANLIGPPIAGKISDVTHEYNISFYLAGFFISLSGLLLMILPATNRYKKFQSVKRQVSCDDTVPENTRPTEASCYKNLTSCLLGKFRRNEREENEV